jgi:O-antigen/teichoic acid export membrane protein
MSCRPPDTEEFDAVTSIVGHTERERDQEPENPSDFRTVFLSNAVWMLVGNLAAGLSQWAQLVVLAKIGSIEMVGSFALSLAICLPVLMFSSLGLRVLQVTDTKRGHRLLEYAALRLITLCGSVIIIFVIGLASGRRGEAVISTLFVSGAKCIEYLSDILYGSLQQREQMAGIGISMMLRAILGIVALPLAVYWTHSLVWGTFGLLVSSAFVLLGYDIRKSLRASKFNLPQVWNAANEYLRNVGRSNGFQRLWKLAVAGMPMGIVLMLVSLNINIPRYFIQEHLGTRDLAIFSAIATLLTAGSVVTNAVGQAAAPRVATSFSERDWRTFGFMLGALVTVSLGLGLLGFTGAFLFGKQAMRALYRPEYATRQDVLLWLMGTSGILYLGSTLGYALTAVRCLKPQVPLFAIAVTATAISCVVLVPAQGLVGVAMAILLSAVVQCLGNAGLLWNACKKSVACAAV